MSARKKSTAAAPSPHVSFSVDVFDQSLASPQEILLIHQFKKKLGEAIGASPATPELNSEIGHLRFIRGYQGNVDEAANAYQAGLAWRAANGATIEMRNSLKLSDDLDEDALFAGYADLSRLPHWDKVGATYPERFFHRRDNEGNPIMITANDMIRSISGLLTLCTKEEYSVFRTARLVNLELMLDALSKKRGKLIKCVYIWDLKGFSYSLYSTWQISCVKSFWSDFDEKSAVAFPESALRIVAVNVPGWLNAIWQMVKRVVPARTLRKVVVVGTSNVAESLGRSGNIPASSLPTWLGGTCPEAETARLFSRSTPFDVNVGALDVPAGEVRFVDVPHGPGVQVLWGVLITAKDVMLSVELVSVQAAASHALDQSIEKSNIIFVPARMDNSIFPRGFAVTKSEGAVRIIVDNSKSLVTSKHIEWCVAIRGAPSSS